MDNGFGGSGGWSPEKDGFDPFGSSIDDFK